jgi:hypothetical protein
MWPSAGALAAAGDLVMTPEVGWHVAVGVGAGSGRGSGDDSGGGVARGRRCGPARSGRPRRRRLPVRSASASRPSRPSDTWDRSTRAASPSELTRSAPAPGLPRGRPAPTSFVPSPLFRARVRVRARAGVRATAVRVRVQGIRGPRPSPLLPEPSAPDHPSVRVHDQDRARRWRPAQPAGATDHHRGAAAGSPATGGRRAAAPEPGARLGRGTRRGRDPGGGGFGDKPSQNPTGGRRLGEEARRGRDPGEERSGDRPLQIVQLNASVFLGATSENAAISASKPAPSSRTIW